MLIVQILQTKGLEDPEAWEAMGKPILELYESEKLPMSFRGFISLMKVNLHIFEWEIEEGLATLAKMKEDKISSLAWNYLRANLLMMDESYKEAIDELESYAKFMGWDSDSLGLLADCYYFEGNIPKAREVALRGLADNPRASLCAATWALCSSVKELRAEAAELFAQGAWKEQFYEDSLDYLIDMEEMDKAKVLFQIFREEVQESELFEYYQEIFKD